LLVRRVTSVVYQSNNVAKVSATYGISTRARLQYRRFFR